MQSMLIQGNSIPTNSFVLSRFSELLPQCRQIRISTFLQQWGAVSSKINSILAKLVKLGILWGNFTQVYKIWGRGGYFFSLLFSGGVTLSIFTEFQTLPSGDAMKSSGFQAVSRCWQPEPTAGTSQIEPVKKKKKIPFISLWEARH